MNFNLLAFCFTFWQEIKEREPYRRKYEIVTNLKLNICIPQKEKWEQNLTSVSLSSGFIMRCLQITSPILNINYRITNAHLLLYSLCHLITWILLLINSSFLQKPIQRRKWCLRKEIAYIKSILGALARGGWMITTEELVDF